MDSRIKIIQEQPLGTRPNWDEYMMVHAMACSTRSSCKKVHSGSVLFNPKHEILATGYNGASGRREKNCLETGCRKAGEYIESNLNVGDCVGIHSEMNCIGHLSKVGEEDLSLTTTILPCPPCSKNMEPYNISKITFKQFYSPEETIKSLNHLFYAKIEVYQLDLSPERFSDIFYNEPEGIVHSIWSPEQKERIKEYQTLTNNSASNPNAQTE